MSELRQIVRRLIGRCKRSIEQIPTYPGPNASGLLLSLRIIQQEAEHLGLPAIPELDEFLADHPHS